jgi:cell division protein FtsW
MRKKNPNKIFFIAAGILVLAGFFILASASMGLLTREGTSFYKVLLQQFFFGIVVGGVLFLIASKIHYKNLKKFALHIFILSFLLTALVFVRGIGFEHGGSKRWIKIGLIFFQPSEILKFGFIIYLSAWIASRKSKIESFKSGFLPFLIIIALVGLLLILEPDIGTLGVIALSGLLLFFLGGGRFTQLAALILLGLGILYVLILLEPYRMNRIITFLDPSFDQTGIGYQLKQSLIAIGSGGIFGRGFGMSIQKFNYLPEPIGDSIFAVFGEEFGFVGSVFLVSLFLFFIYKGFSLALRAPDDFSRLLGAGIVILIAVGSFINIASMVGILPLTGIPLVFISKGGSAMAITLAELGVLFNISKHSKL